MRHENVTAASDSGTDWKGLGYLVSVVSVLFLGAVAWPKPGDPGWHLPALIAGMVLSTLGMAFRYKAHRDQQREMRRTKRKAEAPAR